MQFLHDLEGKKSKSVQKRGAVVQSLKCPFLGNLELWVSLYIEKGSVPSLDAIDWAGSDIGKK